MTELTTTKNLLSYLSDIPSLKFSKHTDKKMARITIAERPFYVAVSSKTCGIGLKKEATLPIRLSNPVHIKQFFLKISAALDLHKTAYVSIVKMSSLSAHQIATVMITSKFALAFIPNRHSVAVLRWGCKVNLPSTIPYHLPSIQYLKKFYYSRLLTAATMDGEDFELDIDTSFLGKDKPKPSQDLSEPLQNSLSLSKNEQDKLTEVVHKINHALTVGFNNELNKTVVSWGSVPLLYVFFKDSKLTYLLTYDKPAIEHVIQPANLTKVVNALESYIQARETLTTEEI